MKVRIISVRQLFPATVPRTTILTRTFRRIDIWTRGEKKSFKASSDQIQLAYLSKKSGEAPSAGVREIWSGRCVVVITVKWIASLNV